MAEEQKVEIKDEIQLDKGGIAALDNLCKMGAGMIGEARAQKKQEFDDKYGEAGRPLKFYNAHSKDDDGRRPFNGNPYDKAAELFTKTLPEALHQDGKGVLTSREYNNIRTQWTHVESLVRNEKLAYMTLADGSKFADKWNGMSATMNKFFEQASKAFGYGYGLKNNEPAAAAPKADTTAQTSVQPAEHDKLAIVTARLQATEAYRAAHPGLDAKHNAWLDKYVAWNKELQAALDPNAPEPTQQETDRLNTLKGEVSAAVSAVGVDAKTVYGEIQVQVRKILEGPKAEEKPAAEQTVAAHDEQPATEAKPEAGKPAEAKNGTPAAEDPVAKQAPEAEVPQETVPEKTIHAATEYAIASGDTLWAVAADHYGLDKHDIAGIQNAVNHIAVQNGMNERQVDALSGGTKLMLPPKEALGEECQSLNWHVLDKLAAGRKVADTELSSIEKKDFGQTTAASEAEASQEQQPADSGKSAPEDSVKGQFNNGGFDQRLRMTMATHNLARRGFSPDAMIEFNRAASGLSGDPKQTYEHGPQPMSTEDIINNMYGGEVDNNSFKKVTGTYIYGTVDGKPPEIKMH